MFDQVDENKNGMPTMQEQATSFWMKHTLLFFHVVLFYGNFM